MADINLTEKELGFINDCVMGKRGVLKETPGAPFPSLYRKGIIEKKDGGLVVAKQFRDLFYTEEQIVEITPEAVVLESDTEPKPVQHHKKPIIAVFNPGLTKANEPFEGYMDLMKDLCDGLDEKVTKGTDEFALIEKVKGIHFKAKRALEAEGEAPVIDQVSTDVKRPMWIKKLAPVVAAYFGVETARGTEEDRKCAVFTGEGHMCAAARAAFDYMYKIGNRRAQRRYDQLLFAETKGDTKGAYDSSANEYVAKAYEVFGLHKTDVVDEDGNVIGTASAIEMSKTE